MIDKDKAFEEWLGKAPACFVTTGEQMRAARCGWDAHAERVRPLVEAARKKIDASTLEEHTVADAEVCAAIADIDALTDREGEK